MAPPPPGSETRSLARKHYCATRSYCSCRYEILSARVDTSLRLWLGPGLKTGGKFSLQKRHIKHIRPHGRPVDGPSTASDCLYNSRPECLKAVFHYLLGCVFEVWPAPEVWEGPQKCGGAKPPTFLTAFPGPRDRPDLKHAPQTNPAGLPSGTQKARGRGFRHGSSLQRC